MPSVLYITPNQEDYLGDGLLHGLRTMLGDQLVDLPKAEHMYSSYPSNAQANLYGRGFTLFGLLDDLPVERLGAFQRARDGDFDLVVFSDIWRTFGVFTQLLPELDPERVAVIDGADRPELYPYAGIWWRKRLWWPLPRAHTRVRYFKRERTDDTAFFRFFMALPRVLAARALDGARIRPIAFSIPEEKIVDGQPEKSREFASHIVDPEVSAVVEGADTGYRFERESDYYADLRSARFGITTRKAGWDCMRHYEVAANGAVPCFRDLEAKPPLCAPFGLLDGLNCISYRSYAELRRRIDALSDAEYERLRGGALDWARANTTRRRAGEFLAELGYS